MLRIAGVQTGGGGGDNLFLPPSLLVRREVRVSDYRTILVSAFHILGILISHLYLSRLLKESR